MDGVQKHMLESLSHALNFRYGIKKIEMCDVPTGYLYILAFKKFGVSIVTVSVLLATPINTCKNSYLII